MKRYPEGRCVASEGGEPGELTFFVKLVSGSPHRPVKQSLQ
jgi:hypothetical protein